MAPNPVNFFLIYFPFIINTCDLCNNIYFQLKNIFTHLKKTLDFRHMVLYYN